jgi:hypothetical protein
MDMGNMQPLAVIQFVGVFHQIFIEIRHAQKKAKVVFFVQRSGRTGKDPTFFAGRRKDAVVERAVLSVDGLSPETPVKIIGGGLETVLLRDENALRAHDEILLRV